VFSLSVTYLCLYYHTGTYGYFGRVARPLNPLTESTRWEPRPSLTLRRAGTVAACAAGLDGTEISCYKQHRTRPCKKDARTGHPR
jgi:hypothetical protein